MLLICCILVWFNLVRSFEGPHFAIVMVITEKSHDPNFYLFNRTLESVLKQTYQGYTLVLVVDALRSASVDILFKYLKRVPKEKWIYQNIKYEKTERFIHKLRKPLRCNQNKISIEKSKDYW